MNQRANDSYADKVVIGCGRSVFVPAVEATLPVLHCAACAALSCTSRESAVGYGAWAKLLAAHWCIALIECTSICDIDVID